MTNGMKQRSTEWRQARLGNVTASCFSHVLTVASPKGIFSVGGVKGGWHVVCEGNIVSGSFFRKADATDRQAELVAEWCKTHWSQTAESYLNEKVSELLNCKPSDVWRSDATDWGTANEPYAFEAAIPVVEEMFGQKLSLPEGEFAYIEHPTEPGIGCSPDGAIGDDRLLELKCPYSGAKWVAAKRAYDRGKWTIPNENRAQVQGSLWVAEKRIYAFGYFDPRVRASGIDPLLMIEVERDNDYIDNVLAPKVCAFRDYVQSEYKALLGEEIF